MTQFKAFGGIQKTKSGYADDLTAILCFITRPYNYYYLKRFLWLDNLIYYLTVSLKQYNTT